MVRAIAFLVDAWRDPGIDTILLAVAIAAGSLWVARIFGPVRTVFDAAKRTVTVTRANRLKPGSTTRRAAFEAVREMRGVAGLGDDGDLHKVVLVVDGQEWIDLSAGEISTSPKPEVIQAMREWMSARGMKS